MAPLFLVIPRLPCGHPWRADASPVTRRGCKSDAIARLLGERSREQTPISGQPLWNLHHNRAEIAAAECGPHARRKVELATRDIRASIDHRDHDRVRAMREREHRAAGKRLMGDAPGLRPKLDGQTVRQEPL